MTTDRFWLWLHRYSARKAQAVRQRQPEYLAHYQAGIAAGRAKVERQMEKRKT